MPKIQMKTVGAGVRYCVIGIDGALSSATWALNADDMSPSGRRAVPVLLGLLEDERITEEPDCSVVVPYAVLASLPVGDLRRLGLPEPAPVTMLVENDGLLTDHDFRFRYSLLTLDGQPLLGASREGVFLRSGAREWTLPDPLFSLLEIMDAFNVLPAESVDERFRRWAEIRQLLPEEGIEVDEYLRGTQVGFASAFTLDVRASESGEITFDPVLVRPRAAGEPSKIEGQGESGEMETLVPSLPEAAGQSLSRQFGRFREARARYALGDGWFVAVDDPVRRALQVVREMQQATPADRRRFAANPHAVLRERLASTLSEEDIENLFYEPPDYGQRVAAAGIWKPKILPFLRQAAEAWLPPEVLGLLIDGREIRIEADDVQTLKRAVESALARGASTLEYRGERIPATEEALRVLDTLDLEVNRSREAEAPAGATALPIERQVLLLQARDNVLELGYAPTQWTSRDGALGTPPGLASRLKPHQAHGLLWLQRHWLDGSPGALLADDMGLGKTLQVLAFLLWMERQPGFRRREHRPFLIVAPTGLLANWVDEHDLHLVSPGLGSPLRAYSQGLRAIRHEQTRGIAEASAGAPVLQVAKLAAAQWVVTTYETLRDYVHSFARVRWACAVLDEAQKIKNPGALVTEECKAIASNAEFVIALTGTPVENRLADLWSIVDTCQPGVLRDLKSFASRYDTHRDESGADLLALKDQITHTSFPPKSPPGLMLRRMKWQELRGLPEKRIEELRQEMPPEQAAAYDGVVERARSRGRTQSGMLEALHHLRSVSLHPRILATDEPDESYISASARLSRTFSVLDQVNDRRDRALIFLESRDLQPILQGLIQRRYRLDHPPMIINGDVAGDRRKQLVRRFQESSGFDCMLLSPKAGGVGLTLTSANHVIHLSRWWNPAVEDQCTDRIYRIGQDRTVFVHIPMAIHPRHREFSFDERLHLLLERKRNLSRSVLGLTPSGGRDADLQALYGDTVDGGGEL